MFVAGEKVAVVHNGGFSGRLMEILQAYDCQVLPVQNPWGQAADLALMHQTLEANPDVAGIAVVANETSTGVRNPVQELADMAHQRDLPIFVDAVSAMGGYSLPVDEWGLDIVATSSNKALETPPGLAILSVSDRAWHIIDAKKDKGKHGWYYNLQTWKKYQDTRPPFPFPTTMASSLVLGLRTSLKRMIETETLEGHWARCAWAQRMVRVGLRNIGFEMLVDDKDASFTITTVVKRPDMDNIAELRDFMLEEHNFLFSTAFGPLADTTLRFGHIGKASSQEYLIPSLLGIEDYVRRVKGVDIPAGASLIGLENEPRWY
jgi:aspartate aminotransferase-like enzyme